MVLRVPSILLSQVLREHQLVHLGHEIHALLKVHLGPQVLEGLQRHFHLVVLVVPVGLMGLRDQLVQEFQSHQMDLMALLDLNKK